MLRRATSVDIPAIQRVRASVRENRLVSTVISDADVRRALDETGRGWVVETDGEVVAFAIGNATNGNVWALFVRPDHERRGHGRQLLDTVVSWLSTQRVDRVWLSTQPGTRAEKFYRAAGWTDAGRTTNGEVRFERLLSASARTS
jgi:GNAT superfamily N-acetyltransferase